MIMMREVYQPWPESHATRLNDIASPDHEIRDFVPRSLYTARPMRKTKYQDQTQFAALPCRLAEDGTREIMLLTSRDTGRWVIPKGWPIKGLKPRQVAAREAFEEAGLRGRMRVGRPIGKFHYAKQIEPEALLCEVRVYLMWVDEQLNDWPEKAERRTEWFSVADAAARVDEGALSEIILRLS